MKLKSQYTKQWRENNKAKFKASEQAYYQNNRDQILVTKSKYETNRKKTDLNYKLRKLLRSRLSSAVKNSKAGSAVKDLGCTIPELRKYIESKFESGMGWDNWGTGDGKWQLDHIKPLCSFNLTIKEELESACNYKNLQPIWYREHIMKSKQDINVHSHISVKDSNKIRAITAGAITIPIKPIKLDT